MSVVGNELEHSDDETPRLSNRADATPASVFEKLQRTNDRAEIWWDSTPLDFPGWRDEIVDGAPDRRTAVTWEHQLDRFLDVDDPRRSLVRGVTTNPSLIAKSILNTPEIWELEVRRRAASAGSRDVEGIFWSIYQEAVRRACVTMQPLWTSTEGRYGWVSGQLDPRLMFDADRMLDQALRLATLAPNLMLKIPGTAEGYQVIEEVVARGLSVNNTLSYTVPQFMTCIRAVERGLARARWNGVDTSRWRAVITHMIGRFGAHGDLHDEAAARGIELSQSDVRWAELAVLKEIDSIIRDGGYPVKMLLSSLEVEDPAQGTESLSMHLEQSAGAAIAYTCKPDFVAAVTRRQDEIHDFDAHAIDRKIPSDVRAKLMRLPYFRRAIDPNGMRPDEFASHGAFVSTYAEVNQNVRKLIDFVHQHSEEVSSDTVLTSA